MGIWIGEWAEHVTISGVTALKMWGDGFYIQDANDVRLCSVVAENNRRQGLSIIQIDGLEIRNSTFKNTARARVPESILSPITMSNTSPTCEFTTPNFSTTLEPALL